ncbi:ATP-binding protein [Clostridium senegalense]|uniref:ATP-binding protein n=1 Tax=Clostridium senegalense TaxID=1465809 RepID=UPI001C113874|nr:ATP-binding protein [Clostridium senegalense]MBU5228121.1 ATP-binding protein [Clostridium senegalense]
MTKRILFLGADGVGKTHLMLSIGKILSGLNNEVLLLDSSKRIYNYFTYNSDVENEIAATKDGTVREDMYIASDINLIEENKYDYILIEDNVGKNLNLQEFFKVFVVQNFDKDALMENKKIIQKYNNGVNDFNNVHFIFNQMLDTTSGKDFLLQELLSVLKNKTQIMNNEDIEIEFNESDLVTASINKWNGNVRFKKYSPEFKQALYQITNIINEFDNKQFKKIIERRF